MTTVIFCSKVSLGHVVQGESLVVSATLMEIDSKETFQDHS